MDTAPTIAQFDPYAVPLDQLDPADPYLFQAGQAHPVLRRLRIEAPVHYCAHGHLGPYWSVTRYRDILAVENDTDTFSSEGSITYRDRAPDFQISNFIAMDPPKHDIQRAAVAPMFTPDHLAKLEADIRRRAVAVLEELPIGETFDWVDRVSIELTTQMLAILFDFPWQDRRKLTRWSDVATALPGYGIVETEAQRRAELLECLEAFTELWHDRAAQPLRPDLISMLVHSDATRVMDPMEYLGNIILLIVGGNDTTRNSMTGGLLALHQHPGQYARLRDDPALIATLVPEIIRWQTPLAYMRRTATRDVEFRGQTIRRGDRVLMWYLSANRDETAIPDAGSFVIDRSRPRKHLSFGFGLHRCLGERLAEMQLRILWEELLARFDAIEVVGVPRRVASAFVHGFETLPVRISARRSTSR